MTVTAPATRDPTGRRSPVVRHASALMFSTVASAAFGFGFWVVAARWFPAGAVGQASATVSGMTLLAGVAQLNLASLYARYVPTAGVRTRPVILGGAGATIATAAATSALYLWLGPVHGSATGGLARGALFGVAVVVTALYFIADGAMTALGRAGRVPVKNVVTSAAKLLAVAMLGVFGAGGGHLDATGLLVAWIVPVATAVAVVAAMIVRRWIPAHVRVNGHLEEQLNHGEIVRFAGAEYVNAIVSNTVAFAPPVLVAAAVGPTRGAYFYLPWLVGVAGVTLLWNIVTPFVTAASTSAATSREHLGRSIRLGIVVAGGGALVLATLATPLLSVLGGGYAAEGSAPLRLIGLSLPFTAMILLFGAFCVMRRRMWGLTLAQGGGAVAFFAGSFVLLPHLGLVGPALAYLVSQVAVALAVTPIVIGNLRTFGHPARTPAAVGRAAGG